jgi:hypothetical protein
VERDVWDWCLYSASLLAAITAIILFLPWTLERRRRPEVKIDWGLSLEGDPVNLDDWPANRVPKITPGQAVCIQVAVHNVGDRASEAALTNFVVPDCLDLRSNHDLEAKPAFSGNPTAGLPPAHRVAYIPARLEPWTPGNSYMFSYQVNCSTRHNQDQPVRIRLLFDIADTRFNRSGRRWLPSLLPPIELGQAQAGEPWPPRSSRRRVRWVRAAPRGRVACARGSRRDVRDLIVRPAVEPSASQAKHRNWLLDHPGFARLINRAAHALLFGTRRHGDHQEPDHHARCRRRDQDAGIRRRSWHWELGRDIRLEYGERP